MKRGTDVCTILAHEVVINVEHRECCGGAKIAGKLQSLTCTCVEGGARAIVCSLVHLLFRSLVILRSFVSWGK
jgi:hypothetical protein